MGEDGLSTEKARPETAEQRESGARPVGDAHAAPLLGSAEKGAVETLVRTARAVAQTLRENQYPSLAQMLDLAANDVRLPPGTST